MQLLQSFDLFWSTEKAIVHVTSYSVYLGSDKNGALTSCWRLKTRMVCRYSLHWVTHLSCLLRPHYEITVRMSNSVMLKATLTEGNHFTNEQTIKYHTSTCTLPCLPLLSLNTPLCDSLSALNLVSAFPGHLLLVSRTDKDASHHLHVYYWACQKSLVAMNSIWKVTVWSLTFSIHKHSWIIIMMSLDTRIENTTCGVHRGGRHCSLKSTRGDSDKGDSIVQPVGIDCNFVSRICRTTPWETLDKVYRERGRETSQSVGWCSRASGMETTSSTCNSLYWVFLFLSWFW